MLDHRERRYSCRGAEKISIAVSFLEIGFTKEIFVDRVGYITGRHAWGESDFFGVGVE